LAGTGGRPIARSPRRITKAAKCINLAHCTSGCAQGAKASTDITYWPAAIRAGVKLRTRCRVREITTNEHGMASGVVYYDADGVEHFQPAEVVILACNAVGTARILLNSAPARFPSGLANSSGLVGKNLMFHPYARIAGYFDEALDGYRGPGNCIWSQEFYKTDRSRGFVRGYTFEFSRGQGPVTGAVHGMQIGRLPWVPSTRAPIVSCSATAPAWWRSARTCPRSTTPSRSIRC